MTDAAIAPGVAIVPANEASCEDLQAVLGARGDPSRCQCQRFEVRGRQWDSESASVPVEQRAARLREQTRCGHPVLPAADRIGGTPTRPTAGRELLEAYAQYAGLFYNVACCESLAGRTADALEHLRRAINLSERYRSLAKDDSDFDPIRDEPAFKELIGR